MDTANLQSSPQQQDKEIPSTSIHHQRLYLLVDYWIPQPPLSSSNVDQTAKESTDAAAAASRFGSIQLDSGDESDDLYSGVKPQKKKKKKRSKKTATGSTTKHQTTIVESDDDDDDNNVPSRSNKRGSVHKDFQNWH